MSKHISLENLQKYDVKIKENVRQMILGSHDNKDILDNFSEDAEGKLQYKGADISSASTCESVTEEEFRTIMSDIMGGISNE